MGRPKRNPDHRFKSRLKYWREKRLMSLTDLAKASKITAETISDIERGIRFPMRHTMTELAKALGVSLADLEPIDTEAA